MVYKYLRIVYQTHLGANPRNHVKHYSCSTLENFLLLFDSNVRIINTKKQALLLLLAGTSIVYYFI